MHVAEYPFFTAFGTSCFWKLLFLPQCWWIIVIKLFSVQILLIRELKKLYNFTVDKSLGKQTFFKLVIFFDSLFFHSDPTLDKK